MSERPDEPTPLPTVSVAQRRSARRLLQRKQREATGTFLVEGPQAVREALPTARLVLITDDAAHRHPELVTDARDRGVEVVRADDLRDLTDAVTPQGVVAVVPTLQHRLADALGSTPQLVVVCAQIRDPGNAGTVIRCADAFGADAVIMTAGSVDVHNPKTVRASVGSLFHLPVVTGPTLDEAVAACRAAGLQVLAADGAADATVQQSLDDGTLARPTAWLLGNEAWGLPDADRALADRTVAVDMWGSAESLNLATAAAVCLYTTAAAQRAADRPTAARPTAAPR